MTGGVLTAVLGILIMPWRLYADAGAYIHLAGRLLEPHGRHRRNPDRRLLAPLRRRHPAVPELFLMQGRYTYRSGFNPRALAALVLAILPVVPGFLCAATTPGGQVAVPNLLDHLYTYAWFVTFALSF